LKREAERIHGRASNPRAAYFHCTDSRRAFALDGATDGMPPMDSAAQAREWHLVMTEAYEKLGRCLRTGLPTPLRPYALTNPAEFFAVSTEIFVERPERLDDWDPDLYRVLATWYRQDPKSRA
jgi:Mlc titration factor MtfA (ptsG expression regulator)